MNHLTDKLTWADSRLKPYLVNVCGMPPRVAESTIGGITPEIMRAIGTNLHGCGLSGPVGCGKTGAVGALIADEVREAIAAGEVVTTAQSLPAGGYQYPIPHLVWSSWPETVNELRVLSIGDKGVEEAAKIVRCMSKARWLVLDDLGAERIRGDYADDWATSQLDLVLDRRYTDMRRTWFTTSLTHGEFVARYGRRMIERLCAENPLIEVPTLESRRLS